MGCMLQGAGFDKSLSGIQCKTGDIVEMDLNLDEQTLKYKVNKEDVAFVARIEDTEYRMAFLSIWKETEIELLDTYQ